MIGLWSASGYIVSYVESELVSLNSADVECISAPLLGHSVNSVVTIVPIDVDMSSSLDVHNYVLTADVRCSL